MVARPVYSPNCSEANTGGSFRATGFKGQVGNNLKQNNRTKQNHSKFIELL